MDLVTGLPYTRYSFDAIILLIGKFSKWVTLEHSNKFNNSTELAVLIVCELLSRRGVPKILISDRD